MVDYQHLHLLPLQTVDEESETDNDDQMDGDDARSNSSTLKSSSVPQTAPCNDGPARAGVAITMTESTDSGLESDKNIDTELTQQHSDTTGRCRNEHLLYHCQVSLPPPSLSLSFCTSVSDYVFVSLHVAMFICCI